MKVSVSEEEVQQYVDLVAENIRASGFVPDVLIGIAKGGPCL